MQVYKGLWNEVQDVAVKMVVGQSAEQQAYVSLARGEHLSKNLGTVRACTPMNEHPIRTYATTPAQLLQMLCVASIDSRCESTAFSITRSLLIQGWQGV